MITINQLPPTNSEEFTLREFTSVNHRPHPFMIGTRHVTIASDKFGGMLGIEAIEYAEKLGVYCATPGCLLSYSQHTCDKVLAINIKGKPDLNSVPGLREYLFSIKETLEQNKIDGVVFVSV
jgi:hypothetical protein